jgi:hypothetical protein
MLRREPDAEAFRSALARELFPVEPRPGGWERVRADLARARMAPRSRPRWMAWLLLAASLLAAVLLAGAFVTSSGSPAGPRPGQAVEAPPIVPAGGALLAIATPISLGEARRLLVRQP